MSERAWELLCVRERKEQTRPAGTQVSPRRTSDRSVSVTPEPARRFTNGSTRRLCELSETPKRDENGENDGKDPGTWRMPGKPALAISYLDLVGQGRLASRTDCQVRDEGGLL